MRIRLIKLVSVLVLISGASVGASEPQPRIASAFLDPGAFVQGLYPAKRPVTDVDVRAKINAMHELGIETIIITYVEYISNKWGAVYPSSLPELSKYANPLGFDLVETVLDEADKNGMAVMLGIGRGSDPSLTYDGCENLARLKAAQSLAERVAKELHSRYVVRHACFAGWYLTLECRNIRYASPYYDYVSDVCHTLTPGKPVMIAPDGSPVGDAEVIAASHVDIFAYQDAVGAGFVAGPAEHYSYDPEKRLAILSNAFRKYASWHARNPDKQIWADVEIWQMDGPEYAQAYPADWSRVRRQIDAVAKHVSQIVLYECGGFLESPKSEVELGGPRAVRLFEAFRAYRNAAVPRRGS